MPPIPTMPDNIPVSGTDASSLPRKERRSLRRTAQYIHAQYTQGVQRRHRHMLAWIMVNSYLRGIHYFIIDEYGSWQPIPRKTGEIRGVVPVIRSLRQHVLGFLNSNAMGVTTVPTQSSPKSLFKANRAEAVLNGWVDDIGFDDIFDEAMQILLDEGTVGWLRYLDPFRQNVFVKPIPGHALFPLPFDASTSSETDGLIYAVPVTRQWMERQDELFERQTGRPPTVRMSDRAEAMSISMNTSLPFLGGGFNQSVDGAVALTVWMKGTEAIPSGEYFFMLGDEIFRHALGEAVQPIMANGDIPVELSFWDKTDGDFWGTGLSEVLLGSQASRDLSKTILLRNARDNRPLNYYNSELIRQSDTGNEETNFIPFRSPASPSVGTALPPTYHVPAHSMGRDLYALHEIARSEADESAGLRSGIAFGQAEGRVESGPATSVLAQNAMSSMTSPLKRVFRALSRTYPNVLDMLTRVWPEEKLIRYSGPDNVGREILVRKEDLPASFEVIIRPRPLSAGGVQAQMGVLFNLKQMPGEDGRPGSLLSTDTFLRSLRHMKMLPPGIKVEDDAESRIRARTNALINDGRTPGLQPADPTNPNDRLSIEEHRTAIAILRDAILDDSFQMYAPPVQAALFQQFQFHHDRLSGGPFQPGRFDTEVDELVSTQLEQALSAAEADLSTSEGEAPNVLQALESLGA